MLLYDDGKDGKSAGLRLVKESPPLTHQRALDQAIMHASFVVTTARKGQPVDVREANSDDLLEIEKLLLRSYPVLMAPAYDAEVLALALPAMTRANPALLNSGTFYVAEDTGAVIGCGGWTAAEPGSGRVVEGLAHVRHFAVDPERAGQGVGRTIYERCSREAGKNGASRFQAFASLNAEPFYRRMGLERLDVMPVTLGDEAEFPAVLMEGRLRQPANPAASARIRNTGSLSDVEPF